ncbi:hypothetical protein ACF0H5_001606 [Mactra antiquata]
MADTESMVQDDTGDEHLCQPCSRKDIKSTANSFCSACKEFQCYDCSNGHKIYAFMSDHKIVSVSEGQIHVSSTDCEDVDVTRYVCTKHNKLFEFYCQQDDAFLCSKCAITSHRKCEVIVDIENMDGRSGCEKLKNELVEAIHSTYQVTELLNETETRLSDDIRALSDKLKNMKARLIKIFDDFTDAILTHASVYSNTTQDDLKKKKVKCETKIKSMKKTIRTLDSIMNTGTPAEQFITERTMLDDVHLAVKDATSLNNELSSIDINCKFNEQLKTFKSDLLSELCSETLDISFHVSNPSKFELVRSIELKQSADDVKEPFYTGIDFLTDGRLVAVDKQNGKCLIYDENLNVKNSYKLPRNFPQCVAVVSDDEVAVTSANKYRLDFLNVCETNDMSLSRTYQMNAKYYSISMMNDVNFVVSTIDHIQPFRNVSMSGDENDFDIDTPSKKYAVGNNYCAYIRGRNKVVQSATAEDKIYIYDIESGENIVIKDKLIKSPCDVAVGPSDHVFVVCKDTKCLVELAHGGHVLSFHQLDMNYPRSIAVSKDKKLLAVSNSCVCRKKLSLYKIA